MRVHISLEDELVRELDERVGARRRSTFIAAALQRALDDERRWDAITSTIGALGDAEHDWDADPARWVRAQRTADGARVG